MDWYYEQMEHAHPVTEEELAGMYIKNYESGRPIQVGDVIFFGLLQEKTDNPEEIDLKMVTFHKDEINAVYRIVDNRNTSEFQFPTLKRMKR